MGLKVNINKTEVMTQHTGMEPVHPQFHIQGEPLKVVDSFTYMGIGQPISFIQIPRH